MRPVSYNDELREANSPENSTYANTAVEIKTDEVATSSALSDINFSPSALIKSHI